MADEVQALGHAEIETAVAKKINAALIRWKWADDNGLERLLWDDSRVDLVTKEYAIEVDWAPKWAESIGQALWYGGEMNLKPAILLLAEDLSEQQRYIYRATTVCRKHGIAVWIYDVPKNQLIVDGYRYDLDEKKPTALGE